MSQEQLPHTRASYAQTVEPAMAFPPSLLRIPANRLAHPTTAPETPLTTTASDVRDVISLLKKHPDGLALTEATDAFKKRVLSPAKVAAYEFWGLAKQRGDQLALTELGWECARRLAPEAEVFRTLLDRLPPYRAVLAWALREELHQLLPAEVLRLWRTEGQTEDARALSDNTDVVSFFHLCQAAELGSVTLARRGQPARLMLDRHELAAYLKGAPRRLADHQVASDFGLKVQTPRLLVCQRDSNPLAAQVREMLALAAIETEVLSKAEPLAPATRAALQRCAAAVFLIDDGETVHSPEWQALLGAAWLRYGERLLLLWQTETPLPASWCDLRHQFIGNSGLSWESGMALAQTLKSLLA